MKGSLGLSVVTMFSCLALAACGGSGSGGGGGGIGGTGTGGTGTGGTGTGGTGTGGTGTGGTGTGGTGTGGTGTGGIAGGGTGGLAGGGTGGLAGGGTGGQAGGDGGTCVPTAEICDGLDNDCDGVVDNGDPGGGAACSTGLQGECAAGTQTCQNGALACVQNVQSAAETCDGKDNDCDGAVDNGNPGGGAACSTGLQGECAAGTQTCQNGAVACVQNVQSAAETCDGKDNDCDGTVDNGNPGGGVACNTGLLGVCAAGTSACTNGAIACNQTVQASAEVCDGLDNDCNGQSDEGNPGGGVACNTGLQGVCAAGTSACTNGAIACSQNVQASAEVCDGLDNDCNGAVDNGNPGGGAACNTGLPAPCGAGTLTCTNGSVTCVGNTLPVAETCDNLDNDCDGLVDDGPIALTVYFNEDFSDNGAGWTLDSTWAVGSATAGGGGSTGNPDPGQDHTTTNDNGVAGVVIGGNYSTTIAAARYLTSPIVNTAAAPGKLYLSFWRWLNSDYPSFVTNVVQVWNGSAWVTVWTSPVGTFITDNAWTKQQIDITAYKNAGMQVRFGYTVGSSGVIAMSGWNIDDVVISNSPNPNILLMDEFSDNSQAWTLGTSWAIGATSASTGQGYGNPDPAADHTLGTNNGVLGAVLGGNVPINHPYYYATSKALNTAGASIVNLSFWRWLNSDYSPYMVNTVEVYNGTTWQNVYQTGGSPGVQDAAWAAQAFNITAHKNAAMQVRIGYTTTSGAFTVSGWNVDDLMVSSGTVCQ